ncbi:MAG: IS3 family transposase [Clostridiaceae bacterium]
MSKILLSNEMIKILSENKWICTVSEKSINYTDEFKIHFIEEYYSGKSARQIFSEAGLDVEMLGGIKRIENASYKWRTAYKKQGILGIKDTRKQYSGRPLEQTLTSDELLQRKDAEIKYLKAEVELLKKLDAKERKVINHKLKPSEIFNTIQIVINNHKLKNMVSYLCKIADVSRSGYYKYLKSKESCEQRNIKDIKIRDIILKAFRYRGYKKGSRSIKMVLENDFNIIYSRKLIQRIMRKFHIVCPHRKANPYRRMAKAMKEHHKVPNLLSRKFKQGIPGKVLLTDITYLPYNASNMAYLSTIKDASTNEILAYHLSNRLTLDIATETIHKLMVNARNLLTKDAFIHSDQGFHYTSTVFQNLLKQYSLGQSMSRRGNCWDNAPQESFFGLLKDEINYKKCTTFEKLQILIDNYMQYYNYHRYQWNLKKLTPVEYRNQLLTA